MGLRPCPGSVQEEAAQCLARLSDRGNGSFQMALALAAVRHQEQVLRGLRSTNLGIRWPLAGALMSISNPEAFNLNMTSMKSFEKKGLFKALFIDFH